MKDLKKTMKKLVIGILAHVDAGKTTLSESMLYTSGKIRKLGRVDNKDAYLDTDELERARGITIFSKQAIFEIDGTGITLLDTPGHVDFSAEMERTLQVLDYAILVISGADGVQGHTKTLWRLLDMYNIPVFIFVNKMDQDGTDRDKLINKIKKQLDDRCIEFGQVKEDVFYDQLAMCDEVMMEAYLETGHIEDAQIGMAVKERKVFPLYFGSALKLEGVEQFVHGLVKYANAPCYPDEFGAKIFKITRDEQGNRLTHMKITGGKLKVKDVLTNGIWEEKVNQIRIYSGQRFEPVNEAGGGSVVAVTGLSESRPGDGLGIEKASAAPVLEPVLLYRIVLPQGCDPRVMMPKLRQIEEEEPEIQIVLDEQLQEIQAKIMGEVQIEILQSLVKSRFDVDVTFDEGRIVYKETIGNVVEGVGHFEPLRHYAEVHLLLEPGERGSGLEYRSECSEDVLGKSWQRLILTHLGEKVHKGVLTGANITDMDSAKIKLLDILCNYQWIRKCKIIAVFDAYRVQGHREEVIDYYNIHLVYTREAQTADNYIEKFAHDNKKNYNITVATSDGLQQMIVRGEGCSLLSARELQAEIIGANNKMMMEYKQMAGVNRNYLVDSLPEEIKKKMENMLKKEDHK